MKKITLLILISFLLNGCGIINLGPEPVGQLYYRKSNLNTITLGQSKQSLFEKFKYNSYGNIPPMLIRAAQMNDNKLIEVGEVLLTDGLTPTVPYWFLFEDGVLVQWGQPQDWKKVSARYEISYNPSVTY